MEAILPSWRQDDRHCFRRAGRPAGQVSSTQAHRRAQYRPSRPRPARIALIFAIKTSCFRATGEKTSAKDSNRHSVDPDRCLFPSPQFEENARTRHRIQRHQVAVDQTFAFIKECGCFEKGWVFLDQRKFPDESEGASRATLDSHRITKPPANSPTRRSRLQVLPGCWRTTYVRNPRLQRPSRGPSSRGVFPDRLCRIPASP